jgi:hypothetical protein
MSQLEITVTVKRQDGQPITEDEARSIAAMLTHILGTDYATDDCLPEYEISVMEPPSASA